MNCTEARDAMLVAELAELRLEVGSNPLSDHLVRCAACRARAASIANQTAHVGAFVSERRQSSRRGRHTRRFVFIASLPVAAALIVAVTISVRRAEPVAPRRDVPSLPVARSVSVDVARGQQTTVLRTADSTVTVIWLAPGEGQ